MLARNMTLALAITAASSALTAPCEPVEPDPPQAQVWSNGDYAIQSFYAFSFSEVPYVLIISGTTTGDNLNGDVDGTLQWNFWLDNGSFSTGAPPDCTFVDPLVGIASEIGATDLDYSTCTQCDPFSEIVASPGEAVGPGCTDELIEFWTINQVTGEENGDYETVWGYRDAASSGWPEVLEGQEQTLEAAGVQGTMYSPLLSQGVFDPVYLVSPIESRRPALAKASLFPIVNSAELQRVEVEGLHTLR